MIFLSYIFGIFLLLSIRSLPCNSQDEGSPCTLPDKSAEALCVRLHYCQSFWSIIKDHRGNLPQAEAERIRGHACGNTQFVCCPDNIVTTTQAPISPSELKSATPKPDLPLPAASDLETIKSHLNYKLINDKCGSSSVDRIVGGYEAKPGELPWSVLLRYKSRLDNTLTFGCGGNLITKFYVLTAAHCINRDLVSIRLGEHKISTEVDCIDDCKGSRDKNCEPDCLDPVQDIEIEDSYRHQQYIKHLRINDIALLRLRTPADTSRNNVETICLPTESVNQIENIDENVRSKMLISGWGKVESGEASDVLLKAYVPLMDNNNCNQRFSRINVNIHDTYLCAGGFNKTDTCRGDSGGPIQSFAIVNGKPRMILYGVVSGGIECQRQDLIFPGIYTNVRYYLDWILDNMKQ
ncbi:CLUMA_CG002005, isoform A [Clunio marinus]|uniref:CLIP domain-containing serine protease n=1 Tax=Clunio marinus TaxID=568069 RepID=A0A1J1HJJ0_9DIPT|nr:CLUMA_CG002005, isoform A [Clunio marinus]